MSVSPFNTLFQSVFRLPSPIRLLRSFCLWLLIGIVCAAVASPLYAATSLDTPVVTAIPGRAQATLTWNAVDGATIYSVYQSTVAGEIGANISNPQVASLSRNGLEIGKRYYFSVQARNSKQTSAISTQVSVVPIDAPVLATPSFQDGIVALSWTKIIGANYYEVFRAPSSGVFGTTALGTATENTFADNTAVGGTTYNYKIRVANPTPNTNLVSNIANVTLMAKPVVTAIPATSRVSLSWNTIGGRSGYSVYQSGTAGQRGTLLKTIQNTNLEITGLTNGANYYYSVVAFNAAGNSTVSDQVKVVPVLGPTLSVAGLGVNSVSLGWTAIEGASYYEIFRAPNNWNFGTTALATTSGRIFTDNTASNGTSYFYRIRVANPTPNAYLISNVANAVPLAKPVLTAQPASGKVSLTWNDVTGRGGYRVYQSETSGDRGTLIKTTLATNLVVSGLNNGSTYYFTVQVFNTTGDGPASDAASATPVGAPTLSVTGVGNGKVSLGWTAVQGASFYEVYRGPNNWNFGATPIATTTSTTCDDSSIASGTSCFYKVRVGNPVSNPNLESNIVNATPLVSPVLTAVVASSKVTLNWNAIAGRSGYNVYQSEVAGQLGTQVKTTLGTSQAITGLEGGQFYFFTVVVVNAAGQSVLSNQVKVQPGPIPDRGGRIVYCARRDGNMNIFIMNADGSNETRLTNTLGFDTNPVFSPDGSKILFLSQRSENSGVYTMNVDGTNQTLLMNSIGVSQPAYSPDGSKIVFASYTIDNYEIFVMNADGTNPTQLTHSSIWELNPSFSPDSTKIVYDTNSNDGIYVMNADGTNQVAVPNTGGSREPVFSTDGTKIAFVQTNETYANTTRIINVDGTNKTEITSGQVYDYTPAFSPNGSKIAISSAHGDSRDIYVLNVDGANLARLTTRTGFDPCWATGYVSPPSPPPTPIPAISGKIAFSSTRDGNTDIYVVNADGTGETRLTTNAAEDSDPSFSGDGSKIVFVSTRDGNNELYVMDYDGANQKRVTFTTGNEYEPAFSPDGKKIAFVAGANGALGLMDSDGRNKTYITGTVSKPAFSPDGSRIVYSAWPWDIGIVNIADRTSPITLHAFLGGNGPVFSADGSEIISGSVFSDTIAIMNANGTNERPLVATYYYEDSNPTVSPDGSRIAFQSVSYGNQYETANIFIIYKDGTTRKQLTTQGGQFPSWAPIYVPPTEQPTPEPTPSVSGRIAFDSTRDDGVGDIYVMNADGSNQTRLTSNPAQDRVPLFSPDGSKIAFISTRDNAQGELYVMDSDGTNQVRLTNDVGSNYDFCFSPDGSKIIYTYSVNDSKDIYSVNVDGTNKTQLTTDGASYSPSFSHDGSKIVFVSHRYYWYGGHVWTMGADGSNQTAFFETQVNSICYPVFSSDDSKVIFEAPGGIVVLNNDGTNPQLATESYYGNDFFPKLSSVGNKIVFQRGLSEGNSSLYTVNTNGSGLNQITLGGEVTPIHVLSPDGSHVAFAANNSGSNEIYTVNIEGTHQVRRTFQGGTNPTWTTGSVPAPSVSVSRAKAPSGSSATDS